MKFAVMLFFGLLAVVASKPKPPIVTQIVNVGNKASDQDGRLKDKIRDFEAIGGGSRWKRRGRHSGMLSKLRRRRGDGEQDEGSRLANLLERLEGMGESNEEQGSGMMGQGRQRGGRLGQLRRMRRRQSGMGGQGGGLADLIEKLEGMGEGDEEGSGMMGQERQRGRRLRQLRRMRRRQSGMGGQGGGLADLIKKLEGRE